MTAKTIARLGLSAALGAVIAALSLNPAPAKAGPIGDGCVEDFWMWQGLRTASRVICDGYRAADGSWERRRGFFDNSYYVPISCSRYSCTGGYWMPELKVIDAYPVTDATVLPDEPGYIESATPRVF